MRERYEVVRAVHDKNLHIIFVEGAFDALPDRIRQLGPWHGLGGGETHTLKPHFRMQLAQQSFAVVYQHMAKFRATQ
jgi:hypothetical protein